jgi:hypothetical protein
MLLPIFENRFQKDIKRLNGRFNLFLWFLFR